MIKSKKIIISIIIIILFISSALVINNINNQNKLETKQYYYDIVNDYRYSNHLIYNNEFLGFNMDLLLEYEYPEFIILEDTLYQDDIIKIIAKNVDSEENIEMKQDIFSDVNWYKEGDELIGIIPTNYDTQAGEYNIEISHKNYYIDYLFEVTIKPRDYKVQNLRIDPSIESSTRNEEAYEEYNKYFLQAREVSESNRYFEGDFLLPTEGILTTEFGEQRYVNDKLTSYRHDGIDIAAPLGEHVLATNTGKVVFTMDMILTGKTIMIDHGQGIFSTYLHLDDILVEEGDLVDKGDLIGLIGTTGFSTGPHLHFTISYYNIPLEPGYFIKGSAFTKEENYYIRR